MTGGLAILGDSVDLILATALGVNSKRCLWGSGTAEYEGVKVDMYDVCARLRCGSK